MVRNALKRIVGSVLLSLSGLLMGCSDDEGADRAFTRDLAGASAKLVAGQALRMDAINKGVWTRVFVFPPYTPLSEIESAIKMKASSAIVRARVSERDDVNLLVFLNAEHIQIVATVPRAQVDFSIAKDAQPLSRTAAVFKKSGSDGRLSLAGGP